MDAVQPSPPPSARRRNTTAEARPPVRWRVHPAPRRLALPARSPEEPEPGDAAVGIDVEPYVRGRLFHDLLHEPMPRVRLKRYASDERTPTPRRIGRASCRERV